MTWVALLYLLVLGAVSTEAATFYVRTDGSDGHSCSQAQTDSNATAKATIQAGINCVRGPGDTVIVRGGTYGSSSTQLIIPGVRGTSSNRITLRATTNETVWLLGALNGWETDNSWWVFDGINVDQQYDSRNDSCVVLGPNVRFQNAEVRNSHHIGIMPTNRGSVEIINVRSHGHGRCPTCYCKFPGQDGQCHGLYLHPGGTQLVDGGEFYNNEGMGIVPVYGNGNVTVRNTKLHHNIVAGFLMVSVAGNHLFYNNLVYRNNLSGASLSNTDPIGIYNNTFYGNGEEGINGSSNNVTIRNNIIYGNGGTINLQGTKHMISHNFTADPKFVNAAAGDFRLQAGSSAINRGVTVSTVTTDFDKIPRPQGAGVDIGAYEYRDGAPRPPNVPTQPRRVKR